MQDGGRELAPECHHTGHVLAWYMAVRGDFVIVGARVILYIWDLGFGGFPLYYLLKAMAFFLCMYHSRLWQWI